MGGVISLITMSSTTLQAQIPATLPDVWVSDVTTTKNHITTTTVNLKKARTSRLYNLTGTLLKVSTVIADEPIPIQELIPGAYRIATKEGANYSFIKQ